MCRWEPSESFALGLRVAHVFLHCLDFEYFYAALRLHFQVGPVVSQLLHNVFLELREGGVFNHFVLLLSVKNPLVDWLPRETRARSGALFHFICYSWVVLNDACKVATQPRDLFIRLDDLLVLLTFKCRHAFRVVATHLFARKVGRLRAFRLLSTRFIISQVLRQTGLELSLLCHRT